MKAFHILIFVLLNLCSQAQTVDFTLSSSGTSFKNDQIEVVWAFGLFLDDQKSSNIQLDEGFIHSHSEDVNTAVSDLVLEADFILSPNPASNFVNVSIDNDKLYQYSLLHQNGQIASEGTIKGRRSIDVTSLPSGLYLMRIENNDEIGLYSFIVQK